MNELIKNLGKRYGVLAESSTNSLTVIGNNEDVALGDLFLIPSARGRLPRIYLFRTTQYANVMNRSFDMGEVARNKLTMPDSYLSEDWAEEKLIQLTGTLLGYAEEQVEEWVFKKPRRLPEHLTDVFHVTKESLAVEKVLQTILKSQLGQEGLYLGNLLVGENALENVRAYLPTKALSHHIGIFGRTGAGKSNLMMVLLKSILDHNRAILLGEREDRKASIFAIDPHDEFRTWHASSGGSDGIRGIVRQYSKEEQQRLVAPFYYLSIRTATQPLEKTLHISRADILPEDLFSIMDFSEQQSAFSTQQFATFGEEWIFRTILGDTDAGPGELSPDFMPGTIAAVQRRLNFLRRGHTSMISPYDPETGDEYDSLLPDIICALEQGRIMIIDTTLLSELEQFLLNTVVARTLFMLRRALRSVESAQQLPDAIRTTFYNNLRQGQRGLSAFIGQILERLDTGALPYIKENNILLTPEELPYVNVVVEEAPSVLNPERMKFGSVFRDISRQGRKFGIGLTVVSQQVSEIDKGVLTQINTELNMSLGNEEERNIAVRNASADLLGFEKEFQVLGNGQVVLSTVFKAIPIPLNIKKF